MKRLSWVLLIPLLIMCSRRTPADIIILGGSIYTMNDRQPMIEAVAVMGDHIVYAGDAAGLQKFKGEKTVTINLHGRTMTPGFIETHGHLMGLGMNEIRLDLSQVRSYDELVDKVREAVSKSKPGEWILGGGWHQEKWVTKPGTVVKGFQTHSLLSSISPDNPVFLEHASGHAVFVNAKAMQIAGVNPLSIEKLSKDLGEGGEVIRDANGNPTGIFVERARKLITPFIPATSPETATKALELALASCLRNGITSFHDAGSGRPTIELYHAFKAEGKLTTRLYVMLEGADHPLLMEWFKKGPEIDPWLTIRSLKLRCDGALGSRGAWLLEPYADRTDTYGISTLPVDTILAAARGALKAGFQVCSHAIGDRANREVLNQYEKAFTENPEQAKEHRFRIEHAQHLHPLDIPRFGKLGVIAAMQAIHLSSDRPWAIERLGEKRIKEGAYMWQSLLKSGAKVINGTDVPVEPINPIACFYASVTRKTLLGEPAGGYEPEEKMTREQALRSYTLDAAYGSFEESAKGSIELGKLADFTIFSKNIMTLDESELLTTEVSTTIVGGKVLFEKK